MYKAYKNGELGLEKNQEMASRYCPHDEGELANRGGRMPTIAENSDGEMEEEEDEEEDEFYYPEELRAMYPHAFSCP